MNKKFIKIFAAFATLTAFSGALAAQEILYSRSHGYTMGNSSNQYKVKKGDTLYRIIRKQLKIGKNMRGVAEKIVTQNPRSFPTKNKNFMLSGTLLNLQNVSQTEMHTRQRNELFFIR